MSMKSIIRKWLDFEDFAKGPQGFRGPKGDMGIGIAALIHDPETDKWVWEDTNGIQHHVLTQDEWETHEQPKGYPVHNPAEDCYVLMDQVGNVIATVKSTCDHGDYMLVEKPKENQ